MKIATVIGARPQFIKAAAVSRLIQNAAGLEEIILHTGQHYDENMSDVFFKELDIPKPQHWLGIGSGPHGQQTGRMLEQIERIVLDAKPDWMLVYGDTNSTLAGALVAAKLHIPLAHVEAGLRSFNRRMPEEINRVLTDHVSDCLFIPTESARRNLLNEGIPATKIFDVGDVMYDAALYYGARARDEILARLGVRSKEYVLATVHRAENTDDPNRLQALFAGLQQVARDTPVVLPLHPRTRAALARQGTAATQANFHLIDPVGYLDMIGLEKHARLIATDSGGVQKEAFFFNVPCVTLRDETEWVELVELGHNRLLPPTCAVAVQRGITAALRDGVKPPDAKLFGGGQAARRIVQHLQHAGRAPTAIPA